MGIEQTTIATVSLGINAEKNKSKSSAKTSCSAVCQIG
jgi:hypothetical protein